MYIKIVNPEIHGNKTYTNTGSAIRLVTYLGKENKNLPIDKWELFFNHEGRDFSGSIVCSDIDNNIKGVARDRPKFHNLIIAPDQNELKYLKYNTDKLKDYTNEVMKQYAANFSIKNNSKLTIDDLVWYGKLEYERNGESKGGNNLHIHVIISERDKAQKISISPNTNDKGRFNRVQFYLKSEEQFDRVFGYKRDESLLLSDQIRKNGSLEIKEKYFSRLSFSESLFSSINAKRVLVINVFEIEPMLKSVLEVMFSLVCKLARP